MGGVAGKAAQPFKGVFEPCEGLVKDCGQITELVGILADRQSGREVFGTNLAGLGGNGGDRRQHPSGDQVAHHQRQHHRDRHDQQDDQGQGVEGAAVITLFVGHYDLVQVFVQRQQLALDPIDAFAVNADRVRGGVRVACSQQGLEAGLLPLQRGDQGAVAVTHPEVMHRAKLCQLL